MCDVFAYLMLCEDCLVKNVKGGERIGKKKSRQTKKEEEKKMID